ncbi:MAG: putative Aminodeoxychorismate lyase [Candidatus Saccharibacteria bacterium]|nr:putative Aminodeoxychorismate lyase [Candidatus Saccharibacteria bacterium]
MPDTDPTMQPSMDGVKRQPDYRPEHELPAPAPTHLLELPKVAMEGLDETPPLKSPRPWRKRLLMGIIFLILAAVSAAGGAYLWYQQQLAPVSTDTTKHVRVMIAAGTTPSAIADQLKSAGVIRSQTAFAIYTRLTGTRDTLKAGSYSLQPSLSLSAIVDHLVAGKQDTFNVTFLPGDTLANSRQKIIGLGYSAAEVDAAFAKTYDRPLFATKPATADLEGYLYGETIEFTSAASVEDILNRFFDEYEKTITENNLVEGFKKQGLTLYEGITLASIVQREVPGAADRQQVARVFLNRLKAGMTLGSDVTYQYAAKKLGVDPTPTLDSPYNTRIHTGLPPGPIATPGKSALIAVANPAVNDYLFFLSGDDDVTYYAKTDAQHQQNIALHCQKKCLIN